MSCFVITPIALFQERRPHNFLNLSIIDLSPWTSLVDRFIPRDERMPSTICGCAIDDFYYLAQRNDSSFSSFSPPTSTSFLLSSPYSIEAHLHYVTHTAQHPNYSTSLPAFRRCRCRTRPLPCVSNPNRPARPPSILRIPQSRVLPHGSQSHLRNRLCSW